MPSPPSDPPPELRAVSLMAGAIEPDTHRALHAALVQAADRLLDMERLLGPLADGRDPAGAKAARARMSAATDAVRDALDGRPGEIPAGAPVGFALRSAWSELRPDDRRDVRSAFDLLGSLAPTHEVGRAADDLGAQLDAEARILGLEQSHDQADSLDLGW